MQNNESAQESDSHENDGSNRFKEDNTPPAVRARNQANAIHNLCASAKWFFGWLTDASFSRRFGGDMHGRVTIGQKDIHRVTGADRKSVSRWTEMLITCRLIWIEQARIPNAYPVNVYCVRDLVPGAEQIELRGLTVAWGRARNDVGKFVPRTESAQGDEATADFAAQNGHVPSPGPKVSPPKDQNSPLPGDKKGAEPGEKCLLADTKSVPCEGTIIPLRGDKKGAGEGTFFRTPDTKSVPSQGTKTDHLKETPLENGRVGDVGGGQRPPDKCFAAWKKRLAKLYPRELEAMKDRLLKDRKSIKLDPKSYMAGPMKKPVADMVAHREGVIERLTAKGRELTPAEKERVAEYRAWLKGVSDPRKEPDSYERGPMKPDVATKFHETNEKIAAIEEALR